MDVIDERGLLDGFVCNASETVEGGHKTMNPVSDILILLAYIYITAYGFVLIEDWMRRKLK
jgi:hypothetical protein